MNKERVRKRKGIKESSSQLIDGHLMRFCPGNF